MNHSEFDGAMLETASHTHMLHEAPCIQYLLTKLGHLAGVNVAKYFSNMKIWDMDLISTVLCNQIEKTV